MKSRLFSVAILLVLLVSLTGNARATALQGTTKPSLVYVELYDSADLERFASTQLPTVAMLGNGLLATAGPDGQQALEKAGLKYQVIDSNLQQGVYYQAQTLPSRVAPDYSAYGQVLLDLGSSMVLRMDPTQVDALTQAGAEVRAISLTPMPLPSTQIEHVFSQVIDPDPLVQSMIDQVSTDQIYQYDRGLAGELPVWVDNAWYTITTRNTNSGTPIQKTTSYVGQHMANDLDLNVDYYVWDDSTNPDVIGEITGLINPQDVFVIGGHIDDVNGTPGADDNASGSVAALVAADILSQYQWGCTLRFAFWTGEEQGLLGSDAYARHVHGEGQNILGYLNLDMIAYNTPNDPDTSIYLGYRSSVPGSLALANLFSDVVDTYNIDLQPKIGTQFDGSSDHTSFLDQGYPAILGIEDNEDFNPYYHGSGDTPAHTDPAYFTDFIKASIATYAHMTSCLIPSGIGSLDGHVTDTDYGTPIDGVTVTATDGLGHNLNTTTDESGYYTRTLLANTYSVTAGATGYQPVTVNEVVVITDSVTTQDFVLQYIPNVAVTPATQTQPGVPGAQVRYVYSVVNDAHVEQEIGLSVESGWPVEAPETTGVLAPEESVLIPVTVTVPLVPDVIIGTDTFTMTAVGSAGGVANATGTTNANVTPGVKVDPPQDGIGRPGEVLTYTFIVTNTGDYTDTFSLSLYGLWPDSLPGGNSTGPMAAGASMSVVVEVTVPPGANNGEQCRTSLRAMSGLNRNVRDLEHVTSTAIGVSSSYNILLPLINR